VGERRWKKAPDEEVQPAKTLWDWLQLLIVPAILVAVTFMWSASQTRSDNKREDRRIGADRAAAEEARQDATLQSYLGEMSGLMLDKKLLTSHQGSAVRAVARTVTLTALRRLGGERKSQVVRFLHEAGLLEPAAPGSGPSGPGCGGGAPVRLAGADLRGADFGDAVLEGTDLTEADLAGANLPGAYLVRANLLCTDLSRAQLAGAFLMDADFTFANLTGANLTGANLTARTSWARTSGAPTSGAPTSSARTSRRTSQARTSGARTS
jgi:Pentapeptide repeats (8 copies)